MAGRRRTGDGELAPALARPHERYSPGLGQPRLPAVEYRLWVALQLYRLARNALARHLPALSLVYIRYYVNEPPVWLENRRLQRATNREVRTPLFAILSGA